LDGALYRTVSRGKTSKIFSKISSHQQRWARPLPGAIFISLALLVVADLSGKPSRNKSNIGRLQMKELQTVLNTVSEGLKTLAKGVEAIAEKVDEVAKSQGIVKPKRKKPSTATKKVKAVKKPVQKASKKKEMKPATDADKVLAIIGRSKKGVGTAAIMQKTGYNQKKIANIIYRLRKQQKIKSVEKGVYTKL
jgi:hypothetical protein